MQPRSQARRSTEAKQRPTCGLSDERGEEEVAQQAESWWLSWEVRNLGRTFKFTYSAFRPVHAILLELNCSVYITVTPRPIRKVQSHEKPGTRCERSVVLCLVDACSVTMAAASVARRTNLRMDLFRPVQLMILFHIISYYQL